MTDVPRWHFPYKLWLNDRDSHVWYFQPPMFGQHIGKTLCATNAGHWLQLFLNFTVVFSSHNAWNCMQTGKTSASRRNDKELQRFNCRRLSSITEGFGWWKIIQLTAIYIHFINGGLALNYDTLFVLWLVLMIHLEGKSRKMYLGLHQVINQSYQWTKIGEHCSHNPHLALIYNCLNFTSMLQFLK